MVVHVAEAVHVVHVHGAGDELGVAGAHVGRGKEGPEKSEFSWGQERPLTEGGLTFEGEIPFGRLVCTGGVLGEWN